MKNKYIYSYKCMNIFFIKMKILKFKVFVKIYNIKNDTLNENDL